MKTYSRIFLTTFLLLALAVVPGFAQQEAMYTQYMFNGLAINPAYAGSHETLSMTALVREQWTGLEGAPQTQTFSIHSPFMTKRVSLGLFVLHDKIGLTEQTASFVSYAYRLPGKVKGSFFSFGLQAGFMNFNAKYSKGNINDPAFANDVRELLPNIGVGVYYHTKKFYVGGSIPQLIESSMGNTSANSTIVRHYYVTAGYVAKMSSTIKFKPNILIKAVSGAPVELDLNANFLFHEIVWAGLSWRSFDSMDAILQINVTKQLQVGYAYDFTTSTEMRRVNTGSHEVMLNYRVPFGKTKITYPRYF